MRNRRTPLFGLTPEMELQLHLTKAREYWRADRLDLACAAMQSALHVGLHPGHFYDLQRTIEAELGARHAGAQYRVAEHLLLEADPAWWGEEWAEIVQGVARAMEEVTDLLCVRWGRPVLVTLFPQQDWVQFMHARYGYYALRAETHKVCLPPGALRPKSTLRRAARHEITHAAVHTLAGEDVPRWLDEGIAVVMEGGLSKEEQACYRRAVSSGFQMRLEQISGGFESYAVDLGSPRSLLCYAAAGDFVHRLIEAHGLERLRALLRRLGQGQRIDRAFHAAFGIPLPRAEREWHSGRNHE